MQSEAGFTIWLAHSKTSNNWNVPFLRILFPTSGFGDVPYCHLSVRWKRNHANPYGLEIDHRVPL